MTDWKDALGKLIEGIKDQPLLAFVVLIIIVVALLGAQIAPVFQPLIYIIVLVVLLVYAARLLGFPLKARAPQTNAPPEIASPSQTLDARDEYLRALIRECRPARLVGLDPAASDPSRGGLPLDKLYVQLDTRTSVEDKSARAKKDRDAAMPGQKTRPLSALEALATAPRGRMVLLGLPGTGKSTFVRYLTLQLAQVLRDPSFDLAQWLPGWNGQAAMPLIIPLGRLAESFPANAPRGDARLIEQFIANDSRTRDFAPLILKSLRDTGGIVLFDGLDEVADLNARPVVTQAAQDFADQYGHNPATRFLVTCRTFSYTDPRWQLTDWATHELALLTPEKINRFINAWYASHIELDAAKRAEYERKRGNILNAVQPGDRRRLAEIANNPLILTVMAVVNTHEGELPDTRAQVYEKCIDQLLLRWELQRTIAGERNREGLLSALNLQNSGILYDALAEIAYDAHAGRGDGDREGALVTEDLLKGKLAIHLKDDAKVNTFLEYCEGANGLLMWQGEIARADAPPTAPKRRVYAFPHLTFEEYLAAQFLKGPNLGSRVREHLDRNFDRWREVVMFLGEHLCFATGDYERMDAIFAALAPDTALKTPGDWKASWMAGDLLLLYRRRFSKPAPYDKRIIQNLVALIETNQLTARERAEAANTLARLDDPRPGVGVILRHPERSETESKEGAGVLDLVFCEIPAGDFTMGSVKGEGAGQDPDAYDDEQSQFTYTKIREPFYIARYPITNAQFDAFLDDPDGFQNKKWWNGLAQCDNTAQPEKYGGVFDLPNHPVVNVTWYQSVAFARWLDARLHAERADCRLQVYDPTTRLVRVDENLKSKIKSRQLEIRLPTEAEWEKAARGPSTLRRSAQDSMNAQDAWRYPWGNDPDPNRANYADTGIGATSAVGAFADGVSRYGVLDLSGNVWEWCATRWVDNYQGYGKTENNNLEGNFFRVVRGGAFLSDPWRVRCAARGRLSPDYLSRNPGVRVVVAPVRL